MNLIIVESPTKALTISKFLGPDSEYKIISSYGHIRDLPRTSLGIDIEHNFKPNYIISNKKSVSAIKKAIKNANNLILASDEDREGEAIAWHLLQVLKRKIYQRIAFHEITKSAILTALENPRQINMNLVNAQQARRVLDRLVGYKLSPFLWKKICKGLSAGRVQSVAMRLICDRENEINKFIANEYWTITAQLANKQNSEFSALLVAQNNKPIKKLDIKNKKSADNIIKQLKSANYKITNIEKKQTQKHALPPYTTATMQQDAARRLRYSAKQTMLLAQRLYEKGLITYHRTDSLNLSDIFLKQAKNYILEEFGQKYLNIQKYKTKAKTAQEAHEAIRPTNINRKLKNPLYKLIWQRAVASQMSNAILSTQKIDIQANEYLLRANGQSVHFFGFLQVYPIKISESILPKLAENETLKLIKLTSEQHFTQPPARYSEASLIKVLEQQGIGRPSTYAPILSTIQSRGYVKKMQGRLHPQEIGIAVNDILVKHFPKIVDFKFTAKMESDLDMIATGKKKWQPVVEKFYKPFSKTLSKKYNEVEKVIETTNQKCEKCGSPMIIKMGRYGKFLACSGFPKCKNTKPLPGAKKQKATSTGIKCPECKKGELVERYTKRGHKKFWGCSRFPKCKYATWEKPNVPRVGVEPTRR